MPAGRKNRYLHYDDPPQQPPGGWCSEEASSSNPPYVFLSNALLNREIDPRSCHYRIYSKNSELHGIDPRRFLRFFQKTVQNILGIDLKKTQEPTSPCASSIDSFSSSDPSSIEASTQRSSTVNSSTGSTPFLSTSSKKSSRNMDMSDSYYNGSPTSRSSTANPSAIVIDTDGSPIHAEPFHQTSGPHTQVNLHHNIVNHAGGNKASVFFAPPSDVNVGNALFRVSSSNSKVGLVMWKTGNHSHLAKVNSAFTGGSHNILYAHENKPAYKPLNLDQNDAIVSGLCEEARQIRGKSGTGGAFTVFAIQFEKPIKPGLVPIQATNGIIFPAKFMVVPCGETKAKDSVKLFAFNVEYVSNDEDEMNYDGSFDEDASPIGGGGRGGGGRGGRGANLYHDSGEEQGGRGGGRGGRGVDFYHGSGEEQGGRGGGRGGRGAIFYHDSGEEQGFDRGYRGEQMCHDELGRSGGRRRRSGSLDSPRPRSNQNYFGSPNVNSPRISHAPFSSFNYARITSRRDDEDRRRRNEDQVNNQRPSSSNYRDDEDRRSRRRNEGQVYDQRPSSANHHDDDDRRSRRRNEGQVYDQRPSSASHRDDDDDDRSRRRNEGQVDNQRPSSSNYRDDEDRRSRRRNEGQVDNQRPSSASHRDGDDRSRRRNEGQVDNQRPSSASHRDDDDRSRRRNEGQVDNQRPSSAHDDDDRSRLNEGQVDNQRPSSASQRLHVSALQNQARDPPSSVANRRTPQINNTSSNRSIVNDAYSDASSSQMNHQGQRQRDESNSNSGERSRGLSSRLNSGGVGMNNASRRTSVTADSSDEEDSFSSAEFSPHYSNGYIDGSHRNRSSRDSRSRRSRQESTSTEDGSNHSSRVPREINAGLVERDIMDEDMTIATTGGRGQRPNPSHNNYSGQGERFDSNATTVTAPGPRYPSRGRDHRPDYRV